MKRIAPTPTLALYRATTTLLAPLAGPALRRRGARGKEDPSRLLERSGEASAPRPLGALVWLHGVSVGESLSLLPLVDGLRRARPGLSLLVTSGTVTSAEVLAKRLPGGVIHQYAPVDTPQAVRRFLDHWRPTAGLLAESELWPNLILQAKARGVRLALVSARMTEKSARRWARTPRSARALLSAFEVILPQDGATAERLAQLGAQVGPELNLKRMAPALPCDEAELARLRAAVGDRKVVLAASTHSGEEALTAEAVQQGASEALLVLAPRHPSRGAKVAQDLRQAGWTVAGRAAGEPLGPGVQAYVADTLGEMGLFLRLADVVVMGGGFFPGVGGHNPLEAARLGRPILTGPHAANAAESYAGLFAHAAAIEASDTAALARHLAGLMDHPQIAHRMGEAALDYAERQGAALEKALALVDALLPA